MKKINITFLAIVASLGGLLFGFDTAVISGTISLVVDQFQLDAVTEGWYVSSALIGTIMGVLLAGLLSDRFGRKNVLITSAVFFGLSAIGCMLAPDFNSLVIFRMIGGIGVGIASMLSPLYISEVAPAHRRGGLVSLYQFAITIGILLAYFANAMFLDLHSNTDFTGSGALITKVLGQEVWRIMLGSETIPALLFLILLLLIPKSPRWLAVNGQEEKALNILTRIVGESEARTELSDLRENLNREPKNKWLVLKGTFRPAIILGVSLAFLTQVSGINAIIYYGPQILEEAGLQLSEALGGQVIIGLVNVTFTLIAIWKIDRLGRKRLLLTGVSGIVISLVTVGLLFYLNVQNTYLLMIFILSFIACFAFSYGPVVWVFISEIYPSNMRGFAMSLATMAIWIGNTIIAQVTPWFLENLQPSGTFWFFAICTLPAIFIAGWIMPETKNKTLEEIERYWITKSNKHDMLQK